MSLSWTNCTIALGDLQPWGDNPRQLTRAQAARLAESFAEFGQVGPVAVGPSGEVYDGHQRLSVLLRLHGPGYMIDARRASRALTDQERRKLTALLHTGAVGQWDWNRLSGWDVDALMAWGFDSALLDNLNDDAANLALMLEVHNGPELLPSDDADVQDSSLCRCPRCGFEFPVPKDNF